ncbi:MAG: DUF3422 family protein [Pseudomonadota bacterium]
MADDKHKDHLRFDDSFIDAYDRETLTNEVHERLPMSCGSFVRATRATFRLYSFKERWRLRAEDLIPKSLIPEYIGDETDKIFDARTIISLLAGEVETGDDKQSNSRRKLAEIAKQLVEQALRDEDRLSSEKTRLSIKEVINKIINDLSAKLQDEIDEDTEVVYKPYPRDYRQTSAKHAPVYDRVSFFVRPGTERGSHRAHIEDNPYRIRARWELIDHAQNWSFIEDIANSTATSPGNRPHQFTDLSFDAMSSFLGILDNKRTGLPLDLYQSPQIDPNKRVRIVNELSNSVGPSENPIGGRLMTARYWIMPVHWFLSTHVNKDVEIYGGSNEDDSVVRAVGTLVKHARKTALDGGCDPFIHPIADTQHPTRPKVSAEDGDALVRAIAKSARRLFGIESDPFNPTFQDDRPRFRDDFVYSFILDGKGILLSDLRPDEDKSLVDGNTDRRSAASVRSEAWDHASRTIILDLGMTAEQRGRVLAQLMDLATYRIVALSGSDLVPETVHAITELGRKLNMIGIDAPLTFTGMADAQSDARKKRLQILASISSVLDQLNLFYTYGITGKNVSTKNYSERIREILAYLRESRIEGWQPLGEYMTRYYAAADAFNRLASRYEGVRTRVTGALELLQSDQHVGFLEGLWEAAESQTKIMKRTQCYAAISAACAALSAVFTFVSIWIVVLRPPAYDEKFNSVLSKFDDLLIRTELLVTGEQDPETSSRNEALDSQRNESSDSDSVTDVTTVPDERDDTVQPDGTEVGNDISGDVSNSNRHSADRQNQSSG